MSWAVNKGGEVFWTPAAKRFAKRQSRRRARRLHQTQVAEGLADFEEEETFRWQEEFEEAQLGAENDREDLDYQDYLCELEADRLQQAREEELQQAREEELQALYDYEMDEMEHYLGGHFLSPL